MKLSDLSNEDVMSGLHSLVGQGHVLLARLLAYLAEVEERRLDLESACSSLFDFCVRRLSMSEDEAHRRVAAARLGRRFPLALQLIECGALHLTGLLLLREHLTDANHEELLRASSGKTKNEVLELLARIFPRTDAPARVSRIEPLSEERYRVQFTASTNLKEKIQRAADLMRHQNPGGNLETVMDHAFDLLIADLEKKRLGKIERPREPAPKRTHAGYIRRSVRREVFERDGEQCTFVDSEGRRCQACAMLELDHEHARALGGSDEAINLSVRCRGHNALHAERDFGRAHIERKKSERGYPRQRENAVVLRALSGMGFNERDARRALETVSQRWQTEPPVESILKDAILVLTTSS